MRKLRIGLCITELEVGGAEKALTELVLRIDRERFEPLVWALGPRPRGAQASLADRIGSSGVPLRFLEARSWRHFPRTVGSLRQALAAAQPDLLQCFLFHANFIGRLAGRLAGVPTILCGIRVAEPRWWHRWADRITQHLVDRYVCVSSAVAQFSATRTGLAAEKLVVIPNGVEIDRYAGARPADLRSLGVPAGRRAITYVGRLDRQKGALWLIRSAPQWIHQLPDCHLLVVGSGPQSGQLARTCRRLGIVDRVHLLGWRADVPEILAASSLLVLPSRWEGMPNAVLEAMASGLPVVATDVEGVRELLGPAAPAQTVPPGNTNLWARRIVELATHRELAAQLGRQNQQRARERFSIERMVESYQRLWRSVAACGQC